MATESGERNAADGRRDGGGGPSARDGRRRRRRRPLHPPRPRRRAASLSCLLLASASSALALAADDADAAGGPPSLRRRPPDRDRDRDRDARRLNDKFCPGEYKGKAPTKRCAGYLTCDEGKAATGVFSCAGGTMFDVKSGSCTWPDSVDCKVGEELLAQVGKGEGEGSSDDGSGDSEDEDEPEPSKYCPARYTGRAPTKNCRGYVQCNSGKEGISANCPQDAKFNSATSLCEFNLRRCSMLVGDSPDLSDYVGVNELDKFCPADYDGRAPTYDCEGYVDCKDGKARRSKSCPGSTKFDVMIMRCTFSLTSGGCDALEPEPTPSPEGAGGASSDGGDEVTGCPDGHSGYLALPGCEEYIYCATGVELNRFQCSDGTLFFAAGGYCNWADSVSCDTTKTPTRSPTPEPTDQPTMIPTGAPVEFDIYGDVYYPDFSKGNCLNDGLFPPEVGRKYLFSDALGCCDQYFPSNMDACLMATMPSPAPTPTEGAQWYPDYQAGICKNDGDFSDWESNFFFTYEECCAFKWIRDEVACRRAKPIVAYYPDYDTNECRNDGMQSPYESNIFDSLEECCLFEWIDYGLCITGGSDGGSGNGNGVDYLQGEYNDVGTGEPEVLYEFYPDYKKNVCHCDGKQSDFEINIFSSYESCCQFSLIDTDRCRQHEVFQSEKCVEVMPPGKVKTWKPAAAPSKPSKPPPDPVWYPVTEEGFCHDDDHPPKGVLLTVSYQVCCKRFFNLNRNECEERSADASLTTTGPNNPCPGLRSEKKCARDDRCRWDEGDGRCFPATTLRPTRTPTPKPQKPDTKPTRRPNQNLPPLGGGDSHCLAKRQKQCRKDASCTYDAPAGQCHPIPPPANPYYPDYFLNICRDDGRQDVYAADDELYDDHEACCKNKWLNFKTCRKHAAGKKTLEQLSIAPQKGDRSEGDDSAPYYPDYFFNVCRNDGRQSDLETNMFDTMEECCDKAEYIDHDTCMS